MSFATGADQTDPRPSISGWVCAAGVTAGLLLAHCQCFHAAADCAPSTCQGLGKNCGILLDGCGGSLNCGSCLAPETCGGGGAANACGCPSEADSAMCLRLGAQCGRFTGTDACATTRSVDCGVCPSGEQCAGNRCGCAPESGDALCGSRNLRCGSFNGLDNCGASRTVECGSCAALEACVSGQCVCAATQCNGFCVDTSSDPSHCGSCSVACPSASLCSLGTCCPTTGAVCSGVCVVDTSSDSRNCGACGHDCQGGICAGGQCQPIILATNADYPFGIAVDSTSVYWVNQAWDAPTPSGSVMKIGVTGGTLVTLASGQPQPQAVALDANNVYWVNTAPPSGGISSVPKNGGAVTNIGQAYLSFPSIAVDQTSVYWLSCVQFGGCTIAKTLKNGVSTTSISSANGPLATPFGVVTDSLNLYWTDSAGSYETPLAGGSVTSVWTRAAPGLVSDGVSLYWANGNSLMAVSINGGSAPTTLTTSVTDLIAMAVDESRLYWTDRLLGAVLTMPKGGGTVITLAINQTSPEGIAIDSTSVYWTNSAPIGGGAVMKIAK
jgi:hypothetical protein